jgi:hypothetical protein
MSLYLKNILVASSIAIFSSFIISLDKNLSPQAPSESLSEPQLLNETQINIYAAKLNSLLPTARKLQSMIYTRGDYSFQITKYLNNGRPFLYVENGVSTSGGPVERRYYVRDKDLLYVLENQNTVATEPSFTTIRTYFRNNKLISAEKKAGLTRDELNASAFEQIALPKTSYYSHIPFFEDALNRRGAFELVFNSITECSKAKYLVFSNNEIDGYRAPVRVESEDEFIHELSSNPGKYQGEKMDIDWNLSPNNEIVYAAGKLQKD